MRSWHSLFEVSVVRSTGVAQFLAGWICSKRSVTAAPRGLGSRWAWRSMRGVAYVGNVGGAVVDFTALGDPVNIAARMQQHAKRRGAARRTWSGRQT